MKDTKELIAAKALEMFNETGMEYVGMRELAAALGMRVGNITYYFPTKDDLVYHLGLGFYTLNSATHAAHPDGTLYEFLQKHEELYNNAVQYRCLPLSMVHIMKRNQRVAENYVEVKKMRIGGLEKSIRSLNEKGYLKTSAEEQWLLVSSLSLINRFWLSEAVLADKPNIKQQLRHYLKLLAILFKPYATKKGLTDIKLFLGE